MQFPLIETRQLYSQIKSDLITLRFRLNLFSQIFETEENIELLGKVAPIFFFRVLYWDEVDYLSLGISRLLDPANTRYGARASLAKFILDIESLDNNLSAELQADLQNLIVKARRIRQWRNNWTGHRDYNTTIQLQARLVGQGNSPIGFNLTEVRECLQDIGQMLNKFEAKFHDAGQTFANPTPEQFQASNYQIDEPVSYETIAITEGANFMRVLTLGSEHDTQTNSVTPLPASVDELPPSVIDSNSATREDLEYDLNKAVSYLALVDEEARAAITQGTDADLNEYQFFFVEEKIPFWPPLQPNPIPVSKQPVDVPLRQVYLLEWNDVAINSARQISFALFVQDKHCLVFDENAPRIPY